MGITIAQYRSSIGCFNAGHRERQMPLLHVDSSYQKEGFHRDVYLAFLLRCLLLICMDIESNPGPTDGMSEESIKF
jgi:hypothetical protein